MPALAPPAKVLVTGASGYIAAWCVRVLIERGYSVRGTVRSDSKGKYLAKKFPEKFEYVVVEDIEKEGAFDEAVKDVDGILHTASPFHYDAEDPQELIRPAVSGTVGILIAIPDNVKRVVITSSCAAVMEPVSADAPPRTFTHADWNGDSTKQVYAKGKDALAADKYKASKTLAEKAAWDYVQREHKPWDIATVLPTMVYGPTIHEVANPDALNTSVKAFYKALYKGNLKPDEYLTGAGNWVDVRDVATMHVLALSTENAGGKRFLSVGGLGIWQHFLNAAADAGVPTPIKGDPPSVAKWTGKTLYDTTQTKEVLGFQFRPMAECVRDSFADFKERGW